MSMELEAYLTERREVVNRALDRLLPPVDSLEKTVVEAMRYSLLAGGKRIRPILCLAGAEAVGGTYEPYVYFACAIEMIHSYSLIHDDLPAMDDDDFRRGLPTSHKRFGEGAAILAGDGLLTEAFSVMTKHSLHRGVDCDRLLEATNLVANAAGYRGMVGGQMVDLEAEGTQPTLEVVEYMHSTKTAALVRASVAGGAILAGGDEPTVSALLRYGYYLGMAFQIRDDLLNVTGDSRILGKPVGNDEESGKATFPALLGIEASRKSEEKMVHESIASLSNLDGRSDPLRALAVYLLNRKK